MTFTVKGSALSGALTGQPALTYAPSDKTHFHSVEFEGVNIELPAMDSGSNKVRQIPSLRERVPKMNRAGTVFLHNADTDVDAARLEARASG
jgi:hypothetical protein